MSLWAPDGVVPSIPREWPTAHAWLYSWVRTDHPGYRKFSVSGVTYTLASGTYRWDDLIGTQISATAGASASLISNGRVAVNVGDPYAIGWPDRLGWLMGYGREAGSVETATDEILSRYVPPGGIPLLGAQWDEVRTEHESEYITDRSRRSHGYAFGGARLWRWSLTMTRWAYEALCTGWCLRSKVTLIGSNASAMGSSEPGGALTGHVLGLEGAPSWTGPTQDTCRVTLVVAGTTT